MRDMNDKTALGSEHRSRLVQVAQMLITRPAQGIAMVADSNLPSGLRDAISDAFSTMDAASAIAQLRGHESPAVREAAGVLEWVWRSRKEREVHFAPTSKRAAGID